MKFKNGFGAISLLVMLALAFTLSCTNDNPVPPTPYEASVAGNGGVMYDKFWAEESGFDQGDANFNLYNDNANFFRCKQCHAWDGLGTNGSYNSRGPNATRPNVAALNLYELAQDKSPEELFEAMRVTEGRRDISYDLSQYGPTNSAEGDKMPNYTQILTSAQMWDLVKFMKEGMLNVDDLYSGSYTGEYPSGSAAYNNLGKDGNDALGNTFYSDKCASCHGADGTDIDLGGKGVGGFTRSKPYEVQHKTKFGALGVNPPMVGEFDITLAEMKDLLKALSRTADFPTDIPSAGPVSFSTDVQPIFNANCTGCHPSAGGLDLTVGNSYASINNGRVVANDPANSLIYTKPQGSHGGNYDQKQSAIVLQWIEEGAKND